MAEKENRGIIISIIVGLTIIISTFIVVTYLNNQSEKDYKRLLYLQEQELQEEQKLKKEAETEEAMNSILYDSCVKTAYDLYLENWNKECSSRGLGEECRLPLENANIIEDRYTEAKNDCKDRYL